MAGNIPFRNSMLDIQYNLAQNVVYGEDGLSNLEIKVRKEAIRFWKGYIFHEIYNLRAQNDTTNFLYFNYKFNDWIHEGKVEIIRSFAALEVPANIWKPLKLEIPKIGDEIYKFLVILGKLKCYLSKDTIWQILLGIFITPKGTINYVKTAIYLIKYTDLQHKYKYAVACYFCLKKQIAKFHAEYLREYGHRFIFNVSDRLKVFWTYHLDNKDQEFNKQIKKRLRERVSNTEHLLYWAIHDENEVAVYYIWENLSDNAIKNYIIDYVKYSLNYESANIMCYLISQVNRQDELELLCLNHGHAILSKLLFNSRWSEYYNNAANIVYSFTDEMKFLNAVKAAVVFWLENEPNKELYMALLNEISERFQVDIKVDFVFNKEAFLMVLLFVEDEIIMKELLNVGSEEELKLLITNNNIIILVGKDLLDNKKLKIFETFISEFLVGDEMEEFKTKFYELTNYKILK